MQVTQEFCLHNKPLFSGDDFPLDISGWKIARSFFAQILLTQIDVAFDESV